MVTGVHNINRAGAIQGYKNGLNTKNITKANGSDHDIERKMNKAETSVIYEPSAIGLQKSEQAKALQNESQNGQSTDRADVTGKETTQEAIEKSPEYQNQLQELANRENEVIMHEQAHMSAGGEFAGSASYSYTVGPDGKRYISGGEVSINTPSTDDPEEAVRIMERVKQAALAPGNPSGQDMRVAASAASKQMKAQSEIAVKRAEKAYGESDNMSKALKDLSGGQGGKTPFDLSI